MEPAQRADCCRPNDAEYRELDPVAFGEVVARRRVLDGRNPLDRDAWQAAGWFCGAPRSLTVFYRPAAGVWRSAGVPPSNPAYAAR